MNTALVTGGAKRIGAAIVNALATDGWQVVIHYNESLDEAEALAAKLNSTGKSAQIVQCDLRDLKATQRLVSDCTTRYGPITCLVNNASLFQPDWLTNFDAKQWGQQLDVNLRAPILLTKAFAHILPQDQQGCIINILDNKIFSPNPDYFSYSIGKFGLKGLTEMAAMALGPQIRVCGVAPGLTTISGEQTNKQFKRQSKMNLLERSSEPKEIVKAIRFILTSKVFNGQILVVDGGQSLMRLTRDVAFLDD